MDPHTLEPSSPPTPATPPADQGDPAEGAPREDVDRPFEELPTSAESAGSAEAGGVR